MKKINRFFNILLYSNVKHIENTDNINASMANNIIAVILWYSLMESLKSIHTKIHPIIKSMMTDITIAIQPFSLDNILI